MALLNPDLSYLSFKLPIFGTFCREKSVPVCNCRIVKIIFQEMRLLANERIIVDIQGTYTDDNFNLNLIPPV